MHYMICHLLLISSSGMLRCGCRRRSRSALFAVLTAFCSKRLMQSSYCDIYSPVTEIVCSLMHLGRLINLLTYWFGLTGSFWYLEACTCRWQQILSQMEAVVEKKAPKQPRFFQPLQNAEITEGQRWPIVAVVEW